MCEKIRVYVGRCFQVPGRHPHEDNLPTGHQNHGEAKDGGKVKISLGTIVKVESL